MINPSNVVKILTDRVSSRQSSGFSTSSTSTVSFTNRECEVADQLCSILESIVDSHSHTFEIEDTRDHGLDDSEPID